jgi:hypothetical protein
MTSSTHLPGICRIRSERRGRREEKVGNRRERDWVSFLDQTGESSNASSVARMRRDRLADGSLAMSSEILRLPRGFPPSPPYSRYDRTRSPIIPQRKQRTRTLSPTRLLLARLDPQTLSTPSIPTFPPLSPSHESLPPLAIKHRTTNPKQIHK